MNNFSPIKNQCVGTSPPRTDARDKVLGKGVYIDDLQFPGMLYGKVLRSCYAHARIVRIDSTRAEKLPGVKVVVTGQELPFIHGESMHDEPLLARDKVRYAGEAVVAVAAIDLQTAEQALELIDVEYEELPSYFDPIEAARPESMPIHEDLLSYKSFPLVKPVKDTNICSHFEFEKGDMDQGFAESDYIFEDTFTTPVQQHCSLEPHGSICQIDMDDNVTLWTNNDSPYRCRLEIATAFKLPLPKVRVICPPFIGGNFGAKGGLKSEAVAIALATKLRNVPIKVIFTREEEFSAALVRHPSITKMKTGVRKDGSIVARQVTSYWATGAYAEKGPVVAHFGGMSSGGPYKIPNLKVDGFLVYTNTVIAGAMRGYSGPQIAWAYESQMDIIAAKLGIDPLEFRLRHVYRDGDIHNTTGQTLQAEGLDECLEQIGERMEWGKKTLGKDQGRGIACMEKGVKTPYGSAAFVKVNEDGSVDVLSSTTEVGQGSETILCQIAAEELGVPLQTVRKATPDTAVTPFDSSTTSSRSTFHMGNAVKIAAADARQQILELAAKLWQAEIEQLAIRNGNVFIENNLERCLPIAAVLSKTYGSSGTILGRGYYIPDMVEGNKDYVVFWLLGAHGIEVEVNRNSGDVKILKIYAAADVGKAIHRENIKGQIIGGACMGLGFAAYEDYAMKDGHVLNPSFLGYKIPTAADMPEVESIIVEKIHEDGPYGAKGLGEATNVSVPPALANAIYNAVGIRIKSLPITPDKVLEALRIKAERKET